MPDRLQRRPAALGPRLYVAPGSDRGGVTFLVLTLLAADPAAAIFRVGGGRKTALAFSSPAEENV